MLNKEQTSVIVKVVALIVALSFVGFVVMQVIPKSGKQSDSSSKLDTEREKYYEDATSKYQEALKQDSNNLQLLVQLGNLYFDWGKELLQAKDQNNAVLRLQQAIGYYGRASNMDPKNYDVRVDMAIAYFYSGNINQAVAEATKVTQENPKHAKAYFNLGIFYRSAGEKEKAIEAWQKFLELEPQGELAEQTKKWIEELQKQ